MKNKLQSLEKLFSRFICYSIVGWLYEVILWIFEEHQYMNRGFCFGPWLPIYGFGGLIIYYSLYNFSQKKRYVGKINITPLLVFLIVTVASAATELIATYIMDLAGADFHALWSYDDYAINFQERIALLPAIKFGILGCIIIYMAQDKIDAFLNSTDKRVKYTRYLLIILFVIDLVYHLINGSNYNDIPVFYF